MREIKKFILENEKPQWTVPCLVDETGSYKLIQDVRWDDLTCASPDVTVTANNGTVTDNVSFTCQTDCLEGLTFSWIEPNGDHRSSSYQYSENYTHVSKASCKGSNITRLETKRMCYSVLDIPPGNGTEAIAACMDKCQGEHQIDDGQSDAGSENDTSGGHYENDDQVSDKGDARDGHYENDDQISDAGDARDGHYENDDQISDAGGGMGGHYENDDQISDEGDARDGHYENDDQFSDAGGARDGHYENDDQISDAGDARDGHYENDDQFSDTRGARGGNDDQLSSKLEPAASTAQMHGHYDNDKNMKSLVTAQMPRHYDNHKDINALSTAQMHGHYDNDKNMKALVKRDSDAATRRDEDCDSDPEYMTLLNTMTEQEHGAGERNLQCEGDPTDRDPVSRSVSDADMSDHGYMTFPGTDDADDQHRDTEHCNGKEPDQDTISLNEDAS
ncbi:Hypp8644 [Branchiostoma lanceolatum]|uniref:Hypp8644 protein n=1 Tax=Branchiostoma lanceolatum TaxID=7740 RepID=A0A8J9Z9I4_BRALA|nr:Hypp8644 [Branchiostoma lanceolatum]